MANILAHIYIQTVFAVNGCVSLTSSEFKEEHFQFPKLLSLPLIRVE